MFVLSQNDGTFEFLRKYKKKFLIDRESKNKFGSLNKGIRLAKGKYIGILHADDTFYNEGNTIKHLEYFRK